MTDMKEADIDLSRGDGDVAFIETEVTDDVAEEDNPRKALLEEMKEQGLEMENVQVIGIFKQEFSVLLEEEAEIKLNGKKIYP